MERKDSDSRSDDGVLHSLLKVSIANQANARRKGGERREKR